VPRPARLFVLRRSPLHGRGAFAVARIRKGTRIVEYTGEKISHAEADRRYDDDAMEQHHTLLMTVDHRWVLDAAVGGNEARFINHSCQPNCRSTGFGHAPARVGRRRRSGHCAGRRQARCPIDLTVTT